jgi:hypothetical protein
MKTKILILTILITTLFSCNENKNNEMCLKYSTSFINKETQRLVNQINEYYKNNLNNPIAINAKLDLDSIEAEYLLLSKTIEEVDNIDFYNKALEKFYCLVNRKVMYVKEAKVYIDSLQILKFNTKAEIINIASLINYEALNSLTYPFQYGCAVSDYYDYNYYAIADTIKLSEAFKGFVTYEFSSTRNAEYKDYKILSTKRNGKTIVNLKIQLAPNNRLFIIKPEQIGNYEINLEYSRASNLQPYQKVFPLQIKFVVVE